MQARDLYAGAQGRFYSFYIQRPRLGRLVGRLIWDSDFRPLYASLERLRQLAAGTTLLDVACGAGLVFRWLDPSSPLRYIGVDNSPAMLERARQRARLFGLDQAEFHLANVEAIPLEDSVADVCLLYNALQAFADPERALVEVVRCLKPGGELIGSTLVRGGTRRADRLLAREAAKPGGMMGPGGTRDDLELWLHRQGLQDVQVICLDALAVFRARRPPA